MADIRENITYATDENLTYAKETGRYTVDLKANETMLRLYVDDSAPKRIIRRAAQIRADILSALPLAEDTAVPMRDRRDALLREMIVLVTFLRAHADYDDLDEITADRFREEIKTLTARLAEFGHQV